MLRICLEKYLEATLIGGWARVEIGPDSTTQPNYQVLIAKKWWLNSHPKSS